MIVRIVSTETRANSTYAGIRLTAGFCDSEVVANTSGMVVVVASTATDVVINSTALGSPSEV